MARSRRAEWGCDEDAAVPTVTITCSKCSGTKAGCDACDGSGEERLYRCARHYMTHDISVLNDVVSFSEHGMLPDEGGTFDQAATCVESLGVFRTEIARIQEESRRLAKKKGKMKGGRRRGR
jgi:antirestriction protein